MRILATIEHRTFEIEIKQKGSKLQLRVDGAPVDFIYRLDSAGQLTALTVAGRKFETRCFGEPSRCTVALASRYHDVGLEVHSALEEREARAAHAMAPGIQTVKAPMTGMVISVHAAEGKAVAAGETLLALEAMKMQNEIRSPAAALVAKVYVTPGTMVTKGDRLLELKSQ